MGSRFDIKTVMVAETLYCVLKFIIFTVVVIQHLLCPAGAGGIRAAGGLLYHEAVRHRCAASNQPENKQQ